MAEKVLVYGAAGAQGNAIVKKLLERGYAVAGLVRNRENVAALAVHGAEAVVGDFADEASLRAASRGMDRMVLLIPVGLDSDTVRAYGRHAIAAAKDAGVKQIVFITGTRIPTAPTNIDMFEEKRDIEQYLHASGVPFVSLRPTFYMGNFLGPWTKPGIVSDSIIAYPIPKGLKASWISWEDLAHFVVAALENEQLTGQCIDIGGPEALDGDELAKHFATALGRDLQYAMVPHDQFEYGLSQALGPKAGKSVTDMYRWMLGREDTQLFVSDPAQLQKTFKLELTKLELWIKQQSW